MLSNHSADLFWLLLTLIMTSLFWIPYIINRMLEQGIMNALWDPYGDTSTQRAWAQRMMQAHANAVENLVIFVPLMILIQLNGLQSTATATAGMIYFYARLIHFLVFTFAIPYLRVISFLTGFGAQVYLMLILLQG